VRKAGGWKGPSPLWVKAPLVLLRYPGLFVALAVGSMLLALAAASYPLFISATASDLLRSEIAQPSISSYGAGIGFRAGGMPLPDPANEDPHAPVPKTGSAFTGLVSKSPYLEPVRETTLGLVVNVTRADDANRTSTARLFAGDDAASNVHLTSGTAEGGALIPDLVASSLNVGPGDTISLPSPGGAPVTVPVSGVYRSLYKGTSNGYWLPWYDQLVVYCSTCPPPPQPIILERAQFLEVSSEIGQRRAAFSWVAPLAPGLSLDQATKQAAFTNALHHRIDTGDDDIAKLLRHCYTTFFGFCGSGNVPVVSSQLPLVVRTVDRRVTTVEGPAKLLRAAGLAVALIVIAAVGAFAMAARRVEATLLFARGAGPVTVGVRSTLESVLPAAVGAATGFGLALLLVKWLGPSAPVGSNDMRDAIRATLIAPGVAIVLIGIVSSVSFLRHSEHHRARLGVLAKVPWEIGLAAASLVVFARLRSGGAFVADAALGTKRPSVLLLAFPVLFIAGFATIVARLFTLGCAWLRRRSARMPSAPYLAVHRMAGAANLTMLLVAAAGLSLGLFVQALTVAGSMRTTVDAKAEVFIGSDVQATIDYGYTRPVDFPAPFTRVIREYQAGTIPSGQTFDLLTIDTRTFTDGAFWNDTFADRPLPELVHALEGGIEGGVPILIAGGSDISPTSMHIDQEDVPVRVVGRANAFPGMTTLRPLIVVDERRLLEQLGDAPNPLDEPNTSTELWIKGSLARANEAITTLPYTPGLVLTANEVEDIPYIAAVIDTFLVMNGLGLAAALLVIAAMLMYLQARQRSQVVSYGLSLRMGMSSSGHLRALVAELATMLGLAYVAGASLAVVSAHLLVPLLDPLETIPPTPLLIVPATLVAITAPVLLLVAVAGGWLTDRRARAADLGQVMRLAD
jgi:putative ABC transport system permease protein